MSKGDLLNRIDQIEKKLDQLKDKYYLLNEEQIGENYNLRKERLDNAFINLIEELNSHPWVFK
jgi:hypothetical protein